ncbi:MAG: hypothetical protein O3A38_04115 [Proteobacteria bacterium]|nr:hypothetical protein [Pseudomonadota bacterium]
MAVETPTFARPSRSLRATTWAVALIGTAAMVVLTIAVAWLDALAVDRHRDNFNQEQTAITRIAARALTDHLEQTFLRRSELAGVELATLLNQTSVSPVAYRVVLNIHGEVHRTSLVLLDTQGNLVAQRLYTLPGSSKAAVRSWRRRASPLRPSRSCRSSRSTTAMPC